MPADYNKDELIPLVRALLDHQSETPTDKFVDGIIMDLLEQGIPSDQLQSELERRLQLALDSVVDKIGRRN